MFCELRSSHDLSAERTKRRKTETRDVEIMVDYFSEMQEMDPKFFYAIEVDRKSSSSIVFGQTALHNQLTIILETLLHLLPNVS